jgi:hypothetical protein
VHCAGCGDVGAQRCDWRRRPHPGAKAWGEFFELLHAVEVPADFMAERPLNVLPPERGVFDDVNH